MPWAISKCLAAMYHWVMPPAAEWPSKCYPSNFQSKPIKLPTAEKRDHNSNRLTKTYYMEALHLFPSKPIALAPDKYPSAYQQWTIIDQLCQSSISAVPPGAVVSSAQSN